MTPENALIGQVAARRIRLALDAGAGGPGMARFVMQGLLPEVVLAIVATVEADPDLKPRLEICLPKFRFADLPGVVAEHLTDIATADLRHMDCEREGRLMAPSDETQDQTLAQLEKLDAETLLDEDRAGAWVDAASDGMELPEEILMHWEAAFRGLIRTNRADIRQVAAYAAATASRLAQGDTLTRALGASLTALRLPRHDALFEEIAPAKRHRPSEWRPRFESHWRRECYFYKRDRHQLPLPPRPKLQERLEELSDKIRDEVKVALTAYIDAPEAGGEPALTLFGQDWSELQTFFEEAPRNEGRSLGQQTFEFYDIRARELLTDDEWEYLDGFRQHRRLTKGPEDDQFYLRHASEMREEPRLAALWERFVFGQRVDCRDLLEGLAQCLRRSRRTEDDVVAVLVIEGQERTPAHFLGLNDEVCRVFATRYRGLPDALAGLAEFRSVSAFTYPDFAPDIAKHPRRNPRGESARARRLTFKVWLEIPGAEGQPAQRGPELRLDWEFDLKGIGGELDEDLQRLRKNRRGTPLVRSVAGPAKSAARGLPASAALGDLRTLQPASGRDAGAFVPSVSRCHSLSADWAEALTELSQSGLVPPGAAETLAARFAAFEAAYKTALEDLALVGGVAPSLQQQADAYGALLAAITDAISAPAALGRLLKPVLEVGVAAIPAGAQTPPSAIVCPWHPLRLGAQAARWTMFRTHLERLVAGGPLRFTDAGNLYFNELQRALAQPLRPDIVVGWLGPKPIVLAHSDCLHGYSLHEPPLPTMGGTSAWTGENVTAVARQIGELVQNYLRLQPHEKDNLSVVLYNCDAAALPHAVVNNIQSDAERDGDEAMCQVVLKHRDEGRLRELYQQLVSREVDDDSMSASEATRDFMSRLRISIMVDEGPAAMSPEGPPLDIVFCHDVISRMATLAWVEIPGVVRPAASIDAGHWSKRQPVRRGDVDATVYLVCPAQPPESWAHLDAIAALDAPEPARRAREAGLRRIPARQTNMQDPGTRQVLEETHRLGSWVVNFDDLLDRRQLLESDIRVIRYKHGATGGRNLVISSKAPDTLLRATLRSRIRNLDPSYTGEELESLSRRLINDANQISGDIVLRAAKRGSNANELIGVVLSHFLVEAELGDTPRAWFFLDDYASWLGQDEKRIADLLCIAPSMEKGEPSLRVVVTEAKFVAAKSMPKAAKDSAWQLKDTLGRLELALSPDEAPLDREIWLARLSDMLLDALPPAARDGPDWRTAFREMGREIDLRGYSHVFGHAAPDMSGAPEDTVVGVKETRGLQELFGPDSLRAILRRYHLGEDPTGLRGIEVGPQAPTEPSEPVVEPSRSAVPKLADREPPSAIPASPEAPSMEPRPLSHFQALLKRKAAGRERDTADAAWLDDVASRTRNALLRYGMSARLEHKVLTPNSALLKFKGSDELTVAAVERRRVELETTHGLEVLNVRAEPGRVAISIRRPEREVLTLAQVWRDWRPSESGPNARLLIALKEDDAQPLYLEPEPAPHTLVAGSTGSGKSVLVQNILLGIAATNSPEHARIVLIDPKAGVDYFAFEVLPHLQGSIIDTTDAALVALEELVVEMERRYALFKAMRVSNVRSYNQKAAKPLPLIWLIHDEFADWMQIDEYRVGVEGAVTRLGVKARAAGIYLIFAAQRPDATVFPMQLRSNLGNRLILRVDSPGTSDLSLGVKGGGAERLLGKGHLAAILGGGTEPVYAQVPFIDEEELVEFVEAIRADLDGSP